MKTGRPPLALSKEAIEQLAKAGHTLTEIAAKFGCSTHAVRNAVRRYGIDHTFPAKARPHRNAFWRGGRIVSQGYVRLHQPNHPNAVNGYVAEHRLVMERQIGRYLLPSEVVHHVDGNKVNNDPSNLVLFAKNADHLAHTIRGQRPAWTEAGWAKMRAPKSPEHRERIRQGHLRRAAQKRAASLEASGSGVPL